MSEIEGVPGSPVGAGPAPAIAPSPKGRAAPDSERAFDEALAHGDELNEAQAPETRRAIKHSLGRFATSKATDGPPADASGQSERAALAGGRAGEGRDAAAADVALGERVPAARAGQAERGALAGAGGEERRDATAADVAIGERVPADRAGQAEHVAGPGTGAAEGREAVAGERLARDPVRFIPTPREAQVVRPEERGGVAREAVGRTPEDPSGRAGRVAPTGVGRNDGRGAMVADGPEGRPASPPIAAAEGGPHRTAPPASGLRDEIRSDGERLETGTAATAVGKAAAGPAPPLGGSNPPPLASGLASAPSRPVSGATDRPPGAEAGAPQETGESTFVGPGAIPGVRKPSRGVTTAPGDTPVVGERLRRAAPGGLSERDAPVPGTGRGDPERRPPPGIAERPARARVEEEPPQDLVHEPDTVEPSIALAPEHMAGIATERPAPASAVPAGDPTQSAAATAREVVDRILVSVPQSGRTDEVRIGLNASVLDGSSIRIYREAGELRVVFEAPTEESQRFLAENRSVLQQTLAERLPGERVQIGVAAPPSGGPDRDDTEGRSSQQYIADDEVEPDESDVRDK